MKRTLFATCCWGNRCQRLGLRLAVAGKAAFSSRGGSPSNPFALRRADRLFGNGESRGGFSRAGQRYLSSGGHRVPAGERIVPDGCDGDRPMLDPHHVGDRRGNQLESDGSCRGRDAEGAATAGADGARIAAALGTFAVHDCAGRDGRYHRAAHAGLLSSPQVGGGDRGAYRGPRAGLGGTAFVGHPPLGWAAMKQRVPKPAGTPMRVAFQGELGAFSQEAIRQLLGDRAEPMPCQRFDQAIASELAAKNYGGRILKREIEDDRQNFTRFFLLEPRGSKPRAARSGARATRSGATAWKTSLVFSTKNVPGALFRALAVLALRDLNLVKIESRPLRGKPWEYLFYIDLMGHREDQKVRNALGHLAEFADFLRVLGSYRAA